MSHEIFDVIVIGGGHAGTEAALASARLRKKTGLFTHDFGKVGEMSCNPAIGGIGKSTLVCEIDALGGIMGKAADAATIQGRVLNQSKGPAVQATRVQADRQLYKQAIRFAVENQSNLTWFQQEVNDLIFDQDRVIGVVTQAGLHFYAQSVVLTAGTFLGGKICLGQTQLQGGRAGDPPSIKLAEKLRERMPRVGRLKTGTPPRLDGRTIDYSVLAQQIGDMPLPYFSYKAPDQRAQQVPCYLTHTNEKTHEIIRSNLHLSPMYCAEKIIEGVGPRYCPSIEDKVVRFAEKSGHQIFVEPEGLYTCEIYPNGISTSLPYEAQVALIHSIKGFEKAHITRPGYAIEYDYFDPRDLTPWLETKTVKGLFFAGQINGTTGYEEAAAQGLIAGLNAARLVDGKEPWWPKRDEAYLGVLIDDLTVLGTKEPYRMFTSRAEYRLSLRENNADRRLTEIGRELGLVGDEQWTVFQEKMTQIGKAQAQLKSSLVRPDSTLSNQVAETLGPLSKEYTLWELVKRPEVDIEALSRWVNLTVDREVLKQVVTDARYEGYLDRQAREVAKLKQNEHIVLPKELPYAQLSGLSAELIQKLESIRPTTLGQAARIPGMTPAALTLLMVALKKKSVSVIQ